MVITHLLFAAFFMSEPLNHSLNKSFVNPDSFNWIKQFSVSLLRDVNDAMDKNIKNHSKYLLLGRIKQQSIPIYASVQPIEQTCSSKPHFNLCLIKHDVYSRTQSSHFKWKYFKLTLFCEEKWFFLGWINKSEHAPLLFEDKSNVIRPSNGTQHR